MAGVHASEQERNLFSFPLSRRRRRAAACCVDIILLCVPRKKQVLPLLFECRRVTLAGCWVYVLAVGVIKLHFGGLFS